MNLLSDKEIQEARRLAKYRIDLPIPPPIMSEPDQIDESDGIAPARGIILCLLSCLAVWGLIGLCYFTWKYL